MKKLKVNSEETPQIFKTYQNANGTFTLTKEEFDAIVSYFRKIKLWRDIAKVNAKVD